VRGGSAGSVLYGGGNRTRCLFLTKLVVEVHDLSHQPLHQVPPKSAVLTRGKFQLGSVEIVRNPSLKSDRDCRRRLTALQGEVAVADQTAYLVVADPNRQAPQPHAGPCAVRLHPLGGRRLESVTSGGLATRFRRSLRRPSFDVVGPAARLG